MDFTIEYLPDHIDAIPIIAKWHIKQWGHILPGFTLKTYAQFLSSHYKKNSIPTMFVAVYRGKVIGTAALDDEDMDTHPELFPWLASLYVDKKYRLKSVGRALIKRVTDEARVNGTRRLYLFTYDQQKFHERSGWKILFREEYYGELQSVMALEISPHTLSR
jgi:N-acetylglutamate synthase-like GNAT family acetyltransferase